MMTEGHGLLLILVYGFIPKLTHLDMPGVMVGVLLEAGSFRAVKMELIG